MKVNRFIYTNSVYYTLYIMYLGGSVNTFIQNLQKGKT